MPRVSDDHLEARRRQILDAARRCFARNGFHSTSMQDVLSEAGLSAGGVYRYFAGKEDIIGAIAEEAIGTIRSAFDTDDDLPLRDVIGRALAAVDERAEADALGHLALQVWAEAARSEPLRLRLGAAVAEAREALRARIERRHGPEVDAEAIAVVTVALLPGYVQAKVIAGGTDPSAYLRGLDGLADVLRG